MLNFDSGRLSHAYIAEGCMADTIAQTVVCAKPYDGNPCGNCNHCQKAANKIHPDIIFIDKPTDKRDITVEQIRELKRDVIVMPNESQRKAYVINDARLMNISAQNAFLQILEEPPMHVVFILKTPFTTQLLKTILSRCILIKSAQSTELDISVENDEDDSTISDTVSRFYEAITARNVEIAEFMFTLEKLNKEQFAYFVSTARKQAPILLKTSCDKGDEASMKAIAKAEKLLVEADAFLDLNVSIGHISGHICANLVKD